MTERKKQELSSHLTEDSRIGVENIGLQPVFVFRLHDILLLLILYYVNVFMLNILFTSNIDKINENLTFISNTTLS